MNSSQNELLRTIENETLPLSLELTQLNTQSTQTLRDSNVLLETTQSNQTEESVYLQGKRIINQLHHIESRVEQLLKEQGGQHGLG